jgi:GT2 family glycosyltransferase
MLDGPSLGFRAMTVNVSVVVAVYNPGRHIEPLLTSLRAQTMPAEQFETIFVNDALRSVNMCRSSTTASVSSKDVDVSKITRSSWSSSRRR